MQLLSNSIKHIMYDPVMEDFVFVLWLLNLHWMTRHVKSKVSALFGAESQRCERELKLTKTIVEKYLWSPWLVAISPELGKI